MKNQMNPVIQNDILRYKKNKFAANLALLGLVFGCLYFMVLYNVVNNRNFYYKWSLAADVIYNLFFLLLVFLFSEQVKNYNSKLFPLQLIVGGLQIARIFWLPLLGVIAKYPEGITVGRFLVLAICLGASGALIIVSAIIGKIRSKTVANFNKQIESGEVDVMATIKEIELAEEAAAKAAPEVAEKANEEVQNA